MPKCNNPWVGVVMTLNKRLPPPGRYCRALGRGEAALPLPLKLRHEPPQGVQHRVPPLHAARRLVPEPLPQDLRSHRGGQHHRPIWRGWGTGWAILEGGGGWHGGGVRASAVSKLKHQHPHTLKNSLTQAGQENPLFWKFSSPNLFGLSSAAFQLLPLRRWS